MAASSIINILFLKLLIKFAIDSSDEYKCVIMTAAISELIIFFNFFSFIKPVFLSISTNKTSPPAYFIA